MKPAIHIILAAGLFSACSPSQAPEPQSQGDLVTEVAPADLPSSVQAAVSEAMPDMTVLEVLRKERGERVYFDVEGERADGSEIELDILYADGVAEVVEIQRDLPWTDVPVDVQAAATAAGAAEPVRIIESTQTDGSIIYELFADGMPKDPAMEVKAKDGQVEVLTERWPH
jgi:hypothetical protein